MWVMVLDRDIRSNIQVRPCGWWCWIGTSGPTFGCAMWVMVLDRDIRSIIQVRPCGCWCWIDIRSNIQVRPCG